LKSIKKQLEKWRKKNTDGFSGANLTIGGILNRLEIEFRDTALEVFDKFKEDHIHLFRYVNNVRGTGEDAAKKLNNWLDKNKDLPLDLYEEGLRLFSVEQNKNYYKDCEDVPDGNPCVFLRLDDGMFWHSTETNYCEITQSEMKHCGGSNNEDSILYNLMSTSEGGSVRYHVTIEYNKSQNKVIQVLGKANTLPKEKYWPSITKFFEAKGNPLLDKDAFQHMYDDEEDSSTIDKRVNDFIQGIGVRNTPLPAIETWEAMKEQIRDGYYTEKTETFAPINNQTNLFRASLSYSGMTGPVDRPGSAAMITLTLQVILQTKEEDKAEEWRKANPNIFREAREFGESQEFKQLLYSAIPERLTRASRLDIKYSKISNPRLRLGGLGNYKMRMRVSFKIDVRSWNESKGELLAMRFEELLKDTIRDLPGQAMLVFLAVEGNKNTNEGKRKLDRNYLTSMITEVLTEVEGPHSDLLLQLDNPDFVKQGVELLATSQAMFIDDMWHNKLENEPVKDFNWREMMFKLMDEYVFIMESRKDAEMLAEMLKDFYENKGLWAEDGTKKVTSIVADSHNYGDHRVMLDIDKE
jgi:hypothetical protein